MSGLLASQTWKVKTMRAEAKTLDRLTNLLLSTEEVKDDIYLKGQNDYLYVYHQLLAPEFGEEDARAAIYELENGHYDEAKMMLDDYLTFWSTK